MRGRNISTNFFLYSLLSPSISSSFSTLSSSLLCHSYCTIPHHVSRFIYTAASSPVFFSFVSRLSVLFNPFFANPLFRRSSFGSQTVHTRELSSTRNGISVGSPFLSLSPSLFSSLSSRPRVVARSTVANCEYAHYRYLQTARTRLLVRAPRLFSFQISTRIDESFDPSFRSRFSLSPLSRLLLPSVVFFAPPPLLLSSVMHRACFEKEGSKSVPFFEL